MLDARESIAPPHSLVVEQKEDPGESESVPIVTEQPKKVDKFALELIQEVPGGSEEEHEAYKLHGLSSLAVTDSIMIMIDAKCCSCGWDAHYAIRDTNTGNTMLTAVEELHCCYYGSIQNVVIRDLQKIAVARVCYKEKSCFSKKMILAVYAPPDLLVGTVEENAMMCVSSTTDFKILNSDGHPVFYVEYQSPCFSICGCPSHFSVKSGDRQTEVAKILEKTKDSLRLQFNVKMGITSKILLSGFCLGLIHKPYNQKSDENHVG